MESLPEQLLNRFVRDANMTISDALTGGESVSMSGDQISMLAAAVTIIIVAPVCLCGLYCLFVIVVAVLLVKKNEAYQQQQAVEVQKSQQSYIESIGGEDFTMKSER